MGDSKQTQAWSSQFGVDYTERNLLTLEEMEGSYIRKYGVSRTDMNSRFLEGLDRNIRVLEVGSNVGNQLLCLQKAGFNNLYGIELLPYAVELSKKRTKDINIIRGNALDISFKDGWFDLVFTSGLLIHINPSELNIALREIYRCTSRYIWGLEYYSPEYTQIGYRESEITSDLLWKGDFPAIILGQYEDVKMVRTEYFKYLQDDNIDVMYLLQKGGYE